MKGAVEQDKVTNRVEKLTMVADSFEDQRILAGLVRMLMYGGSAQCKCDNRDQGDFTFRWEVEKKR